MQKIVQRYINSEKCFYFTPANLRNTDFTLTETGKMPKRYIIAGSKKSENIEVFFPFSTKI